MTPITKDGEYTTRSRLPVRIYATDGYMESVHGAYRRDGAWMSCVWGSDGRMFERVDHGLDLIPRPKVRKLEMWVNVYCDGSGDYFGTRELADRKGDGRIACVYIEREVVEGEGLT